MIMANEIGKTIKAIKKRKNLTYPQMVKNCNGDIDKDYLTKLANLKDDDAEIQISYSNVKKIAQSLDISLEDFLYELGDISLTEDFDIDIETSKKVVNFLLSIQDAVEPDTDITSKKHVISNKSYLEIANKTFKYFQDIFNLKKNS